MSQRAFRGLLVLAALLAAILYLWKPWDTSGDPSLKLGLDLQGGLRVVLQADTADPAPEDMQAARRVIENRVNQFGVSEALIQTSGTNRILVELPGLTTEEQNRAQDLIGQQAVLEFRLVKSGSVNKTDAEMTPDDLEPTAFTGEVLQNAETGFSQFNQPIVNFQIRNRDAGAFGQFTGGAVGPPDGDCLGRQSSQRPDHQSAYQQQRSDYGAVYARGGDRPRARVAFG